MAVVWLTVPTCISVSIATLSNFGSSVCSETTAILTDDTVEQPKRVKSLQQNTAWF